MCVCACVHTCECVCACIAKAYVCSGAKLFKVLLFLPEKLQGLFGLTEVLHARLPDIPQPRSHLDTQEPSELRRTELTGHRAGGAYLSQALLHPAKVHDEGQLLGPAV